MYHFIFVVKYRKKIVDRFPIKAFYNPAMENF